MKCPFCRSDDNQVLDTRISEDDGAIRRRRRCNNCEKRFTTFERIELSMPYVVKKNGSRCDYDPIKLRASLMLALRKRPISAATIDHAVEHIEEQLLASGEREILTVQIGELVMRELKRIDKIAYIRFASVYKSFEDVAEFREMIEECSTGNKSL